MAKKGKRKLLELIKGKPKKEEQKFFIGFSTRQINAVLLMVLIATFLIQGVVRYLEYVGKTNVIQPWFNTILVAILLLLSSVVLITISGVISPVRITRIFNILSFLFFLAGFMVFLYSLIILF
ncbi:MAG: hypothetical protein Q8Q35_03785 [Nanoarchaeota archaeon]|nr:hypothetical protein [Nanoarchaeota archaeon]